jgi:hypothetical protein
MNAALKVDAARWFYRLVYPRRFGTSAPGAPAVAVIYGLSSLEWKHVPNRVMNSNSNGALYEMDHY